jgi:hypothetical protein
VNLFGREIFFFVGGLLLQYFNFCNSATNRILLFISNDCVNFIFRISAWSIITLNLYNLLLVLVVSNSNVLLPNSYSMLGSV